MAVNGAIAINQLIGQLSGQRDTLDKRRTQLNSILNKLTEAPVPGVNNAADDIPGIANKAINKLPEFDTDYTQFCPSISSVKTKVENEISRVESKISSLDQQISTKRAEARAAQAAFEAAERAEQEAAANA